VSEARASESGIEPTRRVLRRLVGAVAVDSVCVWALGAVEFALVWSLMGVPEVGEVDPLRGQLIGFVSLTLPVWLGASLLESRGRAGTPGKRLLGLRVVGPDGGAPGLARALARNAVKLLPWEVAHAGVHQAMALPDEVKALPPGITALLVAPQVAVVAFAAMAALGARRPPHDRVAGTRVVDAG